MEQLELINAVKRGDIESVKMLLAHGADVNAREGDQYGWTALLYATENHNTGIVKALLDKGADPNIKGLNNGRTALINASKLGLSDIAEALLTSGANVNARDNSGKTALSEATRQLHESSGYIGYKVIIQLLKKAGAAE